MTLNELKEYMQNLSTKLNEDLRNLSDEMESIDPASKDFEDLDIEYNFITGQTVMLNHILSKVGE